MAKSQQYLPCRPFHALDGFGNYYLGKAFLQAAFLGMNWQEQKFFLAQAPGPGVGASNIRSIQSNDITISSDPIENFATTWARNWKAISDTDNDRNTTASSTTIGANGNSDTDNSKTLTATSTSASKGQYSNSKSEMSSSTKAGIAVGATVGALAVAGAVLLSRWRRGRLAVQRQEAVVPTWQDLRVCEKDGEILYPEIGEALHHEADNDHEIHELST